MRRLIMVGACYIDTILSVDHYPSEDEKLRASKLSRRRGGNCPNALEVLQQLVDTSQTSLSLSLISVLPRLRSNGAVFIQGSLGPRVDCSKCIYREHTSEPASCYVIQSQQTGSRTIVNYNDLAEMTFEEFQASIKQIDLGDSWFHFEGRVPDTTLKCIQYLRTMEPSIQISVELEKPGRAGLGKLAAEADLVFYAKGWAQASCYNSMEECLRSQAQVTPKAKYLYCTWGEQGAALLIKPNNACITVPAINLAISEVVDTIGAGDTFVASILFGHLCRHKEWDWSRKLRFANEVAGRKVIQEGFNGLGQSVAQLMR